VDHREVGDRRVERGGHRLVHRFGVAAFDVDRPAQQSTEGVREPGTCGATWLGTPPGNENCLSSSAIPAASRVTSGHASV
jgi:hypothetical protein